MSVGVRLSELHPSESVLFQTDSITLRRLIEDPVEWLLEVHLDHAD
jgi:hypothetical protein